MEWYRGWKAEDLKLTRPPPPRDCESEISFGQSPSLTLWHLPVRYASNQLSAFPVTLKQSGLLEIIGWSMVSKAAEGSSNVSAVTLTSSIDASILILRRGVSVD